MPAARIILAKAMGTCFGVDRAVEMALSHDDPGRLAILGQLVHNPQTVEKLREKGIRLVENLDELAGTNVRHVMITAHGCSDQVRREVESRGFVLHDATCPLVQNVHRTVKRLVKEGFFPVVIGEAQHVEVRGIVGDLTESLVISDAAELARLPAEKRRRLGIVSQTTQNAGRVDQIAEEIKKQPEVEAVSFHNTVCKPTRERQEAVEDLCRQVDVMIVVGGRNSSNTRKLKLLCDGLGVKAYHIESAAELRPEWLAGRSPVGITAGTSTPVSVIDEVYERVRTLAAGA